MSIKGNAQHFVNALHVDGIGAVAESEISASLRASIGKELGAGTYASFFVPQLGLVYVTHEWVQNQLNVNSTETPERQVS